jgi:methyl-accepting chemotaxis protein
LTPRNWDGVGGTFNGQDARCHFLAGTGIDQVAAGIEKAAAGIDQVAVCIEKAAAGIDQVAAGILPAESVLHPA